MHGRTKRLLLMTGVLVASVVGFIAWDSLDGKIRVTITNRTKRTVTDLRIYVSGGAYAKADLAPGQSISASIKSTGPRPGPVDVLWDRTGWQTHASCWVEVGIIDPSAPIPTAGEIELAHDEYPTLGVAWGRLISGQSPFRKVESTVGSKRYPRLSPPDSRP